MARCLEAEEQRAGLVLSDALQTRLKGIIVYDEEATIGLKAGTANYFRGIELTVSTQRDL